MTQTPLSFLKNINIKPKNNIKTIKTKEFDTCGSPGCAVDCAGACPVRNTTRTPLAQYRYLSKSDAKTLDDQVCLSLVTEPHFNTPEEGYFIA